MANSTHDVGHGKFETIGALGISGVLLATAGGIAWHAFDVLTEILSAAPEVVNQSLVNNHVHGHQHGGHHHGIDMDHPVLALNMTIVSIAVKEGLYWITKRAGEKSGSGLMKANAWHHRADAISSVVALVGVVQQFHEIERARRSTQSLHGLGILSCKCNFNSPSCEFFELPLVG